MLVDSEREFILPMAMIKDLATDGAAFWNLRGRPSGGVVLRGAAGSPTRDRVRHFAEAVGSVRKSVLGLDEDLDSIVHDVKPLGEGRKDKRGVRVLSTTFDDIALHTDGYNADAPPRFVVLQMAVPGQGGLTLAARVQDVVHDLRSKTIELLSERVYPTMNGTTSILTGDGVRWKIRFNLHEISAHSENRRNSDEIRPSHSEALSELMEVLDYETSRSCNRIQLQRGDVVVIDNEQTLHGRLSLKPLDVERLMHRVWCD